MRKHTSAIKLFYGMEKISKRIIMIGYVAFLLIFVSGVMVLLFYEKYINDFTTGYYWFGELFELSVDVLAVTVVPVMIFEILIMALGLKKGNEKY